MLIPWYNGHLLPWTRGLDLSSLAYYNEIDPFAARWLRELSDQNLIAPGFVDQRPIQEVRPEDLEGYAQCHFFAGIGAWSFALRLADWPDDVPVWTGSCPCQPFTIMNQTGDSFNDQRHLWPHWFRLIQERRPPVVFGEQVTSPIAMEWLDLVSGQMEGQDYAFGAASLPAGGLGAPHSRQRLFFVADTDRHGLQSRDDRVPREEASRLLSEKDWRRDYPRVWDSSREIRGRTGRRYIVPPEPDFEPLVDGPPAGVGRLRGYGNAIVAPVAASFVEAYREARHL